MKFSREKAQDFFPEAMPLFERHYKEISHYLDILLDIDLNTYYMVEDANSLRCYTARDDSNALIGYAIFFVKMNARYKASKQAQQDVIYVLPEKRGIGSKLIEWCDEQLKAEGVQLVYHHVKAAHNFGPKLEKIGYELVDLIYARRLDK